MLSIGEFSKVTGLTIKTIRLYDERGLLSPAVVRDGSSYRYYDAACVERARVVKTLRELEFSLAEIAQILEAGSDEADILAFLERQQAAIAEKVARYTQVHRALTAVIDREREAAHMGTNQSEFEVQEKSLASMQVAGIRAKGEYRDAGPRLGRLARAAGRQIAGQPLGLYYDREYVERDADFEVCFPVRRAVDKPGIHTHELPGGRCVSVMHRGPYDEIGRSYRRLFEYLRARGLTAGVPSREVYIKGPGMIFKGNPRNYLTEVQLPIEQGDAR